MKLSIFKSTLAASLLFSAQLSLASVANTSVSTQVEGKQVSHKAVEIFLDSSDKKTVNIKMVGSEELSNLGAAMTAHTADEAQWLLRFLLRSKSEIQLNYDNAVKKEYKSLSVVERYTISIDGKEAVGVDGFLDDIRHAYEADGKFTRDLEGSWDRVKSLRKSGEKAEFPAGFPAEGVWK